ncbi:MAG: hypothetical protein HYU53_18310 [Acidobacteria bacterium]|nr:hypothetical protein [Acidobacteriota bacterium]
MTRAAVPVVLLLTFVNVSASERYDSRLQFRSIRTEHFTIHFHQGEERDAARLARLAEEVHVALSPQLLALPRRHTHVILVDQHDEANGWATPLPFNMIEISLRAPSPSGTVGHTDDWLRLVFTHEYTHILHLDRSRGVFRALRGVFGRAPVAYPNVFLPGWDVEGLATFYETAETGAGRLNSGDFRAIVDAAARAGRFEPIDRTTGALVGWPGGHAPYAYGAQFREYLARRFGEDAFGRLADATSGRAPYMPGGAYKRVFGATTRELWREFLRSRAATAPGAPVPTPGMTRRTRDGFLAAGPRWLPDGSILYSARTPHAFPALMRVPPNGGPPERLANRYLGERLAVSGTLVFFDQRELTRSTALQSDLFVLNLDTREVHRLTKGSRAVDPDVSADGRWLIAAVERQGAGSIVRFPVERRGGKPSLGVATTVLHEAGTQFGAPRFSPDGARIAVERRRLGALPHVAIIDAASGAVAATITAGQGRVGEPEWTGSHRLLVTWERPAAPSAIVSADLETAASTFVVAAVDGARSAAVSTRDGRIAFIGYTPDGYDVFVSAGAAVEGLPAALSIRREDAPALPVAAQTTAASIQPSRPYRPASAVPRFWMPIVQADQDRFEIGAGTAGIDALGRHAYAGTVRWSDRTRPDWNAVYLYDRLRPTFFIAASDDVTVWQDADYRETSLDAGFSLPFRTVRRRQTLFGAFHATRERDPSAEFDRRSLRAGYQVTTARRFGYSVSPEEGILAGVTAELTRRVLGADASAATLSADIRAYSRAGGRHRVLALRAAAAASWGDRAGRRVLGAGGPAAPGSSLSFGRDAVGLARGFHADDITGYRAAVASIDYRTPLFIVERGLWRLPVFLRQIHAAVFLDAAHAWTTRFRAADLRASTGVEASADVVLGHYVPLTLVSGIAFRRDRSGARDGPAIFARLGCAF